MQNKDDLEKQRLIDLLKKFEKLCIDFATHSREVGYEEYEAIRTDLISEYSLQAVLPKWIFEKRYGSQFWQYMKEISSSYKGRREFIWNEIRGIYEFIESGNNQPVSISFGEVQSAIKNSALDNLWKKIHARRLHDPEGAITASRTMLESTLKYILDELGVKYEDKDDLPELYKNVSKQLRLSPEDQHEQIFKQILQGITSVVHGFGVLRNKYGDAHGKGKTHQEPEARHVDLVVNLCGTICTFLINTFERTRATK